MNSRCDLHPQSRFLPGGSTQDSTCHSSLPRHLRDLLLEINKRDYPNQVSKQSLAEQNPSFLAFAYNIPPLDGGKEVITARFLHPKAAIAEFDSQKITFTPPQYYILHTLASILKGPVNTSEQRAKVRELAYGKFGKMVINPLRLGGVGEVGPPILTYEGDETRGGSPGRRHRATVFARDGGVSYFEGLSIPC